MKTKAKPKQVSFTQSELDQIFSAASSTWSYVASDAQQIGVNTPKDAVEMVVDAGRIVDIGKLSLDLNARLNGMDYKAIVKLFVKNKGLWY